MRCGNRSYVDGPIQTAFAAVAKKHHMHICLPIMERSDGKWYNTAVMLGRNGEYIGKYRKTHLVSGFEDTYIIPGDTYPVFDLDFGKVAVSICMDLHSPELYRIYALECAELILHPTMAMDYTGDLLESIENARAIDNGVYFAMSRYVNMPYLAGRRMGYARVIEPTGHFPGVACAEIDLDEQYESWYEGAQKRAIPTMQTAFLGARRPETYGVLTRPDEENKWRSHKPKLWDPQK